MAILYYPKILENSTEFPASIFFTFYERENTSKSSMKDTIQLYMPEQFGQPSTVSWDTFRGTEAVTGMASSLLTHLEGRQAKKENPGKIESYILGAMNIFGGPAGDLMQLGSGAIPNPYLAQIFRGVNFRNFSFTFRLVPLSEEDCETILEIIKTFRKWALPDGPMGGASSPYLGYPGEVDIEYKWQQDTNEYIHKFKRSVITELDVDYTGARNVVNDEKWFSSRNRSKNDIK